ncbi:MAG: hypothetical protein RIR26_1087 [Pseudomonadota bacterium]
MTKVDGIRSEKLSAPLLILVGRHPRCPKVRELTQRWNDADWKALCEELMNDRRLKSCLPDESLAILPDFEAFMAVGQREIFVAVKSIFAQRRRHAQGCILTILSCFEEHGAVDIALRRAFETFLSINAEHGKAILLFTHEI